MPRTLHVLVIGIAVVGLAGCARTERRMRDTYHDVVGGKTDRVDLNTASQKELSRLPGLTDDDAARIIANRPYGSVQGLLRKKVIGEGKYEQIRDHVYVSRTGGGD